MFQNYDKVKHVKYRRLMISCLFIMVVLWGATWYLSLLAGLLATLANLYLVAAGYWFVRLYPERETNE